MYTNKEIWTGVYEDTSGLRGCKEFWVNRGGASEWTQIANRIPQGTSLVVIFPGRRPERMRWSPMVERVRSEQQRVDIWEAPAEPE
jgi:hypothetical protein